MSDATDFLLSDEEIANFIAEGYHILEPELPADMNDSVCAEAKEMDGAFGILEAIPRLADVYSTPEVVGALTSILGTDYEMDKSRVLHVNPAGSRSQTWHQDGTNVRHHQVWCVLAMYFPHDTSTDMGPTIIMPGTHLRNAPTDRLASYANIVGQVPLAVKAGTVAITHYDLWHTATRNKSDTDRLMIKFLFNRISEPSEPSWNSTPELAACAAGGVLKKQVGTKGYTSDYYKEWELRREMWNWMIGEPVEIPPGAYRTML
ncbi:MAG: phytanoyl-CoA dioxygenase family protein [Lentisphaeria bacterium]|nr:phytanoyl-CoA dioxygenase family protein [Lentisphaeria bacterium]NQZ68315.1 phytanoyl-CoA dioxygenase family protein [Lentisphaeria bacterium]